MTSAQNYSYAKVVYSGMVHLIFSRNGPYLTPWTQDLYSYLEVIAVNIEKNWSKYSILKSTCQMCYNSVI